MNFSFKKFGHPDQKNLTIRHEAKNPSTLRHVNQQRNSKLAPMYFFLGISLLILFSLQDSLGWKVAGLEQLQQQNGYRILSGFVLLAYLLFQWLLFFFRMTKRHKAAKTQCKLHNYLGALAPFFFYFHSTGLGYAYLFLLSLIYFANVIVGLFNKEVLCFKRKATMFVWMLSHVALSLVLLLLSLSHMYLSFFYN